MSTKRKMVFEETPPPAMMLTKLIVGGAKFMGAFACKHHDDRYNVAVIVSKDPTGDGQEWHASVSASDAKKGKMIRPKQNWIVEVRKFLAMRGKVDEVPFEDDVMKGIHIWAEHCDKYETDDSV